MVVIVCDLFGLSFFARVGFFYASVLDLFCFVIFFIYLFSFSLLLSQVFLYVFLVFYPVLMNFPYLF